MTLLHCPKNRRTAVKNRSCQVVLFQNFMLLFELFFLKTSRVQQSVCNMSSMNAPKNFAVVFCFLFIFIRCDYQAGF